MTVAVSDGGEVCVWLDRCIDFTVFPQRPGVGLVDMGGGWHRQDRAKDGATSQTREPSAG